MAEVHFVASNKNLRMKETNSQFSLIFCEEPFRIFFPTGLLLGMAGVLLWPLFYLGAGVAYPSILRDGRNWI